MHPLTRITNKHLLPLYDRPMVTYAVEALVQAGIDELMLVTGGTHAGEFFRLLGNGHEHGIDRLFYAYQEQTGGIAEALGLAERFVDGDKVCVLLADNVFERTLEPVVGNFERQQSGGRIVLARLQGSQDESVRAKANRACVGVAGFVDHAVARAADEIRRHRRHCRHRRHGAWLRCGRLSV